MTDEDRIATVGTESLLLEAVHMLLWAERRGKEIPAIFWAVAWELRSRIPDSDLRRIYDDE